tara:strand:+ start:66 stop:287 length:222 start_codon:yes stop_codon:yes gene_type:complete
MEYKFTDDISHGRFGCGCFSKPIPVKNLSKRRRRVLIERGIHKGKTAIEALCPMCKRAGRTFWIRVGIVEGGA